MSLIAKDSGGGSFERAPEGLHAARCVRVVDIGDQPKSEQFGGGFQRQIIAVFETEDKDSEGKHYQLSKFYTLSLHEKANLRKDLTGWRGKAFTKEELEGFDLANVIGTCCQIQVIHDVNQAGRETAKIESVVSLKKKDWFETGADEFLFSLDDFDHAIYQKLSQWEAEKVDAGRTNMAKTNGAGGGQFQDDQQQRAAASELDDEIPFAQPFDFKGRMRIM